MLGVLLSLFFAGLCGYWVLTLKAPANKIILVIQNYVQLIIGIWIFLSPWLLGFSSISIMTWSNLIAGIIIILINVWAIFGEATELPEEKEIIKGHK